ncbi:tetratricopeptide repeat protein [Labedaea rhizosphaerae]|uniref:Tetratricopeptide repeat protein n=1 Tax=Labedaea rhizosphaerae TaxID=598644 RepID=A0A4R6SCY5_LABRH|nr:tetratricopeptide repeat protein [Labedaea rhizosphaerae]TDP97792.1 tetratricopeptide repeat protein [Labedaea rhizosphaerae]
MDGTLFGRYRYAGMLFDDRQYSAAATELAELVTEEPDNTAIRLLLARAYYHSAQLTRAEAELREVLQRNPADAYAHLMLGRVLQRQSRHDEAASSLRLAAAMSGE